MDRNQFVAMNKIPIAIYLQHYLAPSMTFIYRQLKKAEEKYNPLVICSDRVENRTKFPFDKLFLKRRNFIRAKKSRFYNKLFGSHTLLSINPQISSGQSKYFSEILNKYQVKLIHAHFGPSGLEIVNLAKMNRIPLLVTFHGYDASILLKYQTYTENLKKLFTYAHIIAVSEEMKHKLVEIGANPDRISVVRCGIPMDVFKFTERTNLDQKIKEKKVINYLQVSNFVEKKGHAYTIEAFSLLLKKNPNSHLTLAGGGELYHKINQLVKEKNLSDHVTFTGVINEEKVKNLMNEADVFVHHSVTSKRGDREGVPTVLMEAMATGLPVISTFHSGIPELINDGINGFLVKERDIESYSEKMHEILSVGTKFSSNARKKVIGKFNLTKEVSHIMDIYKNLIDGKDRI